MLLVTLDSSNGFIFYASLAPQCAIFCDVLLFLYFYKYKIVSICNCLAYIIKKINCINVSQFVNIFFLFFFLKYDKIV